MSSYHGLEVAIVGMAGRFPGASGVEELWQLLTRAQEGVRTFTAEELRASGVPAELAEDPRYVKRYGYVEDADLFDAPLFGYTAPDAACMDPQFRVFHECAWTALENAGYHGDAPAGLIGLYAGASDNLGWMAHLAANPQALADGLRAASLTSRDYLCSRVAYALNLHGPVVTVQTACSTSLVAIHMACQGLINGECDIALAGGVALRRYAKAGHLHMPGLVDSPDGICRPFDARANGIVSGDGCGIVVLRRLEDALHSRDRIVALIKGSAVMSDGRGKAGFMAPGVDGQVRTIKAAQHAAEVEADSIQYIEAHGTATPLGDPIEVEALARAFAGVVSSTCRIGSIKSNIGHLDAAAGVTGVIKAALCLQRGMIPASLHFESPNEKIRFASTPFEVNRDAFAWRGAGGPRRAGVSSFGIGGTNAHAVLEQAPVRESDRTRPPSDGPHMVFLSANTPEALESRHRDLQEHLRSVPDLSLADLCYTLHVGRRTLAYRSAFVAGTREELGAELERRACVSAATRPVSGTPAPCLLFPGQGSQRPGMGRELYAKEPLFRAEVDRCCLIAQRLCGVDYRNGWLDGGTAAQDESLLSRTAWLQPALFIFELSLARMLLQLGCKPAALLGHSVGEYVAACLAEVFSLEDALRLVIARGRLMQELPPGAMLAARISPSQLEPWLGTNLDIAAINGDQQVVVSGDPEAVRSLAARLDREGIERRLLSTSHAFHSRHLQPILGEFREVVACVARAAPRIPFVSNVSGTWIRNEEAVSPDYWVQHLRSTVQFARGLACLGEVRGALLIETGPGRVLTALARAGSGPSLRDRCIALDGGPKETGSEQSSLYAGLCEMFDAGLLFDWSAYYANSGRGRIALPEYRFDRQRYGTLPGSTVTVAPGATVPPPPVSGKNPDIDRWFYEPVWRLAGPAPQNASGRRWLWLLFDDDYGVGQSLSRLLLERGERVVRVVGGSEYRCSDEYTRGINPALEGDYARLVAELPLEGLTAVHVVHLWTVYPDPEASCTDEALQVAQERGFSSLASLCKSLQGCGAIQSSRISVVSSDAQSVKANACCSPAKALVLGLCRVIPQEFPNIASRHIDVHLHEDGSWASELDCTQLLQELDAPRFEAAVAFRRRLKWIETFEPTLLPAVETASLLRDRGVYLITGGLGRIGLTLARVLGRLCRATLVLVSRSPFPARQDWPRILRTDPGSSIAATIGEIRQIEASGSQVEILSADVADLAATQELVRAIHERFRALHGVLHAAGVAEAMPIAESSAAAVRALCLAKVQGTRNLHQVCADLPLDFCMLFSSISTVLGGLGFAAYSGANAFMDRFAANVASIARRPWIAVDWDGWNFEAARSSSAPNSVEQFALLPDEGAAAFARLLALADVKARLVVSTGSLQARYEQYVGRALAEAGSPAGHPLHQRPPTETPLVEPATATERAVAQVWRRCLGLEQVGVLDDVFDLGGDSLLITRLASLLRDRFSVELALKQMFELRTVRAQARALDERLASKASASQSPPLIARRRPGERAPLSFAQQRLWFIDQLEDTGSAYHICGAVRLFGRLDRGALQRTLDALLERHEILRTRYGHSDGEPFQEAAAAIPFQLLAADLRSLAPEDCEAQVRQHTAQAAGLPFDLTRDAPIRGRLLQVADQEWVLLVTMHHIVSDDWSMGLLMQDVGTLYSAFHEGRANPLPPLPVQYADYALWQREWLRGAVLEAQLEYWKSHLQGAPELLELPADRSRPDVQSHRGDSVTLALSGEASAALRELARSCEATLFMVFYAGFAILLSRLSGQDDLVIGAPVANRRHAQVEGLVGFFVNTLPLRARVQDHLTVREYLGLVRETTLAAFTHQDAPFEKVVEAVRPQRKLAHSPVFQVMLTLQNAAQRELRLSGLRVEPREIPLEASKCDLTLLVQEGPGPILTTFSYATDLFERATIQRWLCEFHSLLAGMVQGARQPIRRISLLTAEDRMQVVERFNATAVENESDELIHESFLAQAAREPDALALVAGSKRLSRGELRLRVNQVAHHLRANGVGTGSLVAICAHNSIEMVIGMLGVLSAGAAYVPLDPELPAARLQFVLEDTGVAIVLTEEKFLRALPEGPAKRLCLDRDWPLIAASPCSDLTRRVSGLMPDHLAYVIYTSGSTGQPKGVMVTHASIANYSRHVAQRFEVESGEGSAVLSSFIFDLALTGLYAPLACGRPVRLVGDRLEPAALAEVLATGEALSPVKLTPSHLPVLLQGARARRTRRADVRSLVFGGEPLAAQAVRTWRNHSPGSRIFNHYGPTETTVGCAIYEATGAESGRIPIGKPIANVQLYILDGELEPVPVGQAGEIHVAGVGLARGYLNRPGLSAERFIANPFGTRPGERMYRTGDLGRWRADGNVEYLGRNDQQLKVRGFRVEAGEIESHLCKHPKVAQAAVVLREIVQGEPTLVAYLTHSGERPEAGELRRYLRACLPEHMVPGHFEVLDALPLARSGKLDRRALPAPGARAPSQRPYEAPHGELEKTIATIWQELLHLEHIGRDDDFFELGGNSLQGVALGARLENLGIHVPVITLFSSPTLSGFAQSVLCATDAAARSSDGREGVVALQPEGKERPLFLVHMLTGDVFPFFPLARELRAAVPVYGLRIPERSGSFSIAQLAAHHIQSMRAVQPEGPYRIAGHSFGGVIAWEIATQLLSQDLPVEFVGLIDTYRPAPQARDAPELEDMQLLLTYVQILFPATDLTPLLQLMSQGSVEVMLSECKKRRLLPEALAVEHVRRWTENCRDVLRAGRQYRPQPLPARVHHFTASDPDTPSSQGWEGLVSGSLKVWPVGGRHVSILQHPWVEQLARSITEALRSTDDAPAAMPKRAYSPALALQVSPQAGLRIFCIPGSGANSSCFMQLASALGRDVAVHGMQLRGLDSDLVPHSTVEAAASCFVQSVRELCPRGPYRLVGHSFGSWIALEMGRRLAAMGEAVSPLVLLDPLVPAIEQGATPLSSAAVLLRIATVMEQGSGRQLGLSLEELEGLDEEAQLALLMRKLSAGAAPPAGGVQAMRRMARVFAANTRTVYAPSSPYPGPVVLMRAAGETDCSESAPHAASADEWLAAWARYTPRYVVHSIAGNHMTMLKEPGVSAIAAFLRQLWISEERDRQGVRAHA